MEYPSFDQPTLPVNASLKKDAEKAFREFLQQINKKQSKGFITNSEKGDIFSFETYLREAGTSTEIIQAYCNHAKAINALEATSKKVSRENFWANTKVLSKAAMYFMIAAIFFYALVGAFFYTFDISLWNWKAFSLFVFTGPVIMLVMAYIKLNAAQRKLNAAPQKFNEGEGIVRFIIKYFDNDELTFTKAKSRLFKE
jgi:hypothetical protein